MGIPVIFCELQGWGQRPANESAYGRLRDCIQGSNVGGRNPKGLQRV